MVGIQVATSWKMCSIPFLWCTLPQVLDMADLLPSRGEPPPTEESWPLPLAPENGAPARAINSANRESNAHSLVERR